MENVWLKRRERNIEPKERRDGYWRSQKHHFTRARRNFACRFLRVPVCVSMSRKKLSSAQRAKAQERDLFIICGIQFSPTQKRNKQPAAEAVTKEKQKQ